MTDAASDANTQSRPSGPMTTQPSWPSRDFYTSVSGATGNATGGSPTSSEPRRKGKKKRGGGGKRSPEQWNLIHHSPYGRMSQLEEIEEWLQSVLMPWERDMLELQRKERHEWRMKRFRESLALEQAFSRQSMMEALDEAFGPRP